MQTLSAVLGHSSRFYVSENRLLCRNGQNRAPVSRASWESGKICLDLGLLVGPINGRSRTARDHAADMAESPLMASVSVVH